MDLRKIKKLIELLEESSLAELEIHSGEEHISLRRAAGPPAVRTGVISALPAEETPLQVSEPEEPAEEETPSGEPVTAPIVGTFYEAPSPGARPFVTQGKRIAKGDTLGIIEAMKMMNEIKAPAAGTVEAIVVSNGQIVEFGQVLMYLDS